VKNNTTNRLNEQEPNEPEFEQLSDASKKILGTTLRLYINEIKESGSFPPTSFTDKYSRNSVFRSYPTSQILSNILKKFFIKKVRLSERIVAIIVYNLIKSNDSGVDIFDKDFKIKDFVWQAPKLNHVVYPYYDDYDNETEYDDCDGGLNSVTGDECECEYAERWDDDEEEWVECFEEGDGGCECQEWEEDTYETYYYDILESEFYTDMEELGVVKCGDSFDDVSDFLDCVEENSTFYFFPWKQHSYLDTTDKELESDFEDYLGNTIAWPYGGIGVYEVGDEIGNFNRLYSKSNKLNEEQLSLFPRGFWEFDVAKEKDYRDVVNKIFPERLVLKIFDFWDKNPNYINVDFLKHVGIDDETIFHNMSGDVGYFELFSELFIRYLKNTKADMPVKIVLGCDDIAEMFNNEFKTNINEFICGGFDMSDWFTYFYDEYFDDGILDYLDEKNWDLISKILGVDVKTAENLLEGGYVSEEIDELKEEKEDEIDEIKRIIIMSESEVKEDKHYSDIIKNIKYNVDEKFNNSGEFKYNDNGDLNYIIEDDLKNIIKNKDVWDNVDQFEGHWDYENWILEDVIYDIIRINGKFLNVYGIYEDIYKAMKIDSDEKLYIDEYLFGSYYYPDYDQTDLNLVVNERLWDEFYDTLNEKNTINESKGIEDDEPNVVYEPLTNLEAIILNNIPKHFTLDELEEIVAELAWHDTQWKDFIKIFGVLTNSQKDYVSSTRFAKWYLDNLEEVEQFGGDFKKLGVVKKTYPSRYEVRGDETSSEIVYRSGLIDVFGYSEDEVKDEAYENFWDYDPDMQIDDYGDTETIDFTIGDIEHIEVLSESIIDIKNLPKEQISPPLVEGDKVFVWDVEPDPPAPGVPSSFNENLPSTFVGVVTDVFPDDMHERRSAHRGGIKYVVDTPYGLIGLYQGEGDYDYFDEQGGGRDKWVKINQKKLQEINNLNKTKKNNTQKDFMLKKSFIESIEKLKEEDIKSVNGTLIKNRKEVFKYLDELSENKTLGEENFSHFLIAGKNWVDKFSVVNSFNLDTLTENSNKVRDIIYNNTKMKLPNSSFLDNKRNLLSEANKLVELWKLTKNN